MTCVYVICRETEQAAQDYFNRVARENGDMAAAQNMLDALLHTSSFKALPEVLEQVCAGFGAIGLVGTPAQVVDGFKRLAAIGLDGATITWIDYDEGHQAVPGGAVADAAGSGIAGLEDLAPVAGKMIARSPRETSKLKSLRAAGCKVLAGPVADM